MECHELGYESIQRPQIRSKSPYFQIPGLDGKVDSPLVLKGISLSSDCFTHSDNISTMSSGSYEDDGHNFALSYPIDWESPHLEAAFQTISQPQSKSHW